MLANKGVLHLICRLIAKKDAMSVAVRQYFQTKKSQALIINIIFLWHDKRMFLK